jgi:hypothetical protein
VKTGLKPTNSCPELVQTLPVWDKTRNDGKKEKQSK